MKPSFTLLFTAALVLLLSGNAFASKDIAIAGDWITDKGVVRIAPKNGKFVGVAVDGPILAANRGNPAIIDMTGTRNGWKGKFYLPPAGKYFTMTCTLVGPDALALEIKGPNTVKMLWKRK